MSDPNIDYYPSKLLFFVEFDNENEASGVDARVIIMAAKDALICKSVLRQSFELDTSPGVRQPGLNNPRRRLPKFYMVHPSNLDSTCLVLPSYRSDNDNNWYKMTLICPPEEWPELFTGAWSDSSEADETGIRSTRNGILKCVY
jgi:hypothetical protein